uniref:Pulmonary surfactant-associated protein B n=1 Tax=Sinocyclocheilus rhinocerous TaxID=307959 RepID=A0A673J7U0_9TELE
MQFAFVTFFLFTSTLTSGWARSVDLQLTEPQTASLHMMDNMCTDCKKTVQLLTEILSSQDSQHLIEKSLDKFCYEHPVIPLCMNGAKTYVHLVIRHFSAFAVQVNPLCNFCMLFIKTIESMLPKERTEEAIVNLLEKICDYLPSQYKHTCSNFVETYGKQLIDLLLSSLPPHAICTALGLCLFPETPLLLSSEQTDCDSCKILAILSQLHLGHNATEIQTSDLLQKMCHLHPNAIPRCEGFVKLHGHRLLKSDGKQAPITACEEDYLCRGPK